MTLSLPVPVRKALRPRYNRWWRGAAKTWPVDAKREYLPGWLVLVEYVNAWRHAAPGPRQGLLSHIVEGTLERRVIERAGGVRAAFQLVFGDLTESASPNGSILSAWPKGTTLDDVASNLIQIAHASGHRITP